MIEAIPAPVMVTPEEYLTAELVADERSEFVGGQVLPMPGVSAVHSRLQVSLTAALATHLADHPCEVHCADLKLRLYSGQAYYYPDLMVCCDPTDNADYWRERPRYVVEIGSPQTQQRDDETKAIAYWHVASIEAYLQVWQERVLLKVHRRHAAQTWWVTETLTRPTDELHLDGIGFRASLAQIYQRSGLLPDAD